MFLLVLLCLLVPGGDVLATGFRADVPAGGGAERSPTLPVRFDSEVIRIFVEEDSLRIEGRYRFVISPTTRPAMTMLYPYPEDSLLGGARTLLLEGRIPEGDWQSLPFREAPRLSAVRWRIPLDRGSDLEVRTVYRQARRQNYGRYIVTSTKAWGYPLRSARFEIHLPANAEPVRFSYPFHPGPAGETNCYLFETTDFYPEQDILFEWVDRGAGHQ